MRSSGFCCPTRRSRIAAAMAAIDVPSAAPHRELGRRGWLPYALAVVALGSGLVGLGLGLKPSPEQGVQPQLALGPLATFWLVMSYTVVGLILRKGRAKH